MKSPFLIMYYNELIFQPVKRGNIFPRYIREIFPSHNQCIFSFAMLAEN